MMDVSPVLEDLAIIVVNYRSHRLVEKNLERMLNGIDAVVIVVDSFSSTGEADAARDLCDRHGWHFVETDRNVGFGVGVNLGAEVAIALGCRSLFLVNPDAWVAPGSLLEIARVARLHQWAIMSPRVERPDGTTWFDGATIDRRTGLPGRAPGAGQAIHWLSGACLVTSSRLWRAVGGFDPDYFMYWEDVDFSHRCGGLGADINLIEGVVAVHDVGATQGAGKSALYVRFCCRNRLVFASKHLTAVEILRWLAYTPLSSWRIARRGRGGRQLVKSPRVLTAMTIGSLLGCGHAMRSLLTAAR